MTVAIDGPTAGPPVGGKAARRRPPPALWAAALLVCATACRGPEPTAPAPAELARAMSLGQAHLENREAAQAVAAFQRAVELAPGSAPARRNLARAQLLARETEAALATLGQVEEAGDGSAATHYLLGIATARLGRFAEAVPHFERAVELDPRTAALRYQLAAAYQAVERHPEATVQLEETVRLDPYHATACFKLARYAAAAGDREGYERWNGEFARLRQILGEESRSTEQLEACVYTQAELVPPPAPAGGGDGAPALAVRFAAAGGEPESGPPPTALAVLDVAADGRYTVLAGDADGGLAFLAWGAEGRPERRPVVGVTAAAGAVRRLAVGNYYDEVPAGERYDPDLHARNDVLVLTAAGGRLLLRTGAESFREVTAEAGLGDFAGDVARWVDVEHDGDLDLVAGGEAGLELWRNDGGGSFARAGAEAGLELPGPVTDLAAADLDGDVAVDLVVARGELPTAVLQGRREGRFGPLAEPPGPWPPAGRVLVDDLDGDGYPDAALAAGTEASFRSLAGVARPPLAWAAAPAALALIDFDNDGRLDLAAAAAPAAGGAPAVHLWRNAGPDGWQEATAAAGLSELAVPAAADLVAADVDADGDSDLLLVAAEGGLVWLRNDGGDGHGQLKLRLVGTKTNPLGLGTQVEARAGTFRAPRTVGAPPIEIGIGPRQTLDAVKTVWTNGVVDNQIDVAVGREPLTIVEKNVATGSCPFLYAWDGERFRFVTDLLGNSPLGLPLRRGEPLAADPDELVAVGGSGALAPRGGKLWLEVTSEFREVLYLDQARLVAVDHPPGLEVHPTDKLMPPPFPPSEVWALASPRPLRRAVAADGTDRTAELADLDGRFAPPGVPLPPPWRGLTHPAALTLDFGPLPEGRPLVLALTGWLQYGDASTNIAVSQAGGHGPPPPRLEAETADGTWLPVAVTVGMPAGKTKTILCELAGRLPPGSRRLRLSTAHEIRWDRIALLERAGDGEVGRRGAAPVVAELRFRGFSELASRAPHHPTTPDYERVSDRPPWRTALAGWSTRYGEVTELVAARDGELVIVNAGDAVRLGFDAAAFGPVPAGKVRSFFFYSVGWDKDGDHNVAGGDAVAPLPGQEGAAAEVAGWRLRYNTRWVPRDRFAEPR